MDTNKLVLQALLDMVMQHCYATKDKKRFYYWDAAISASADALEILESLGYVRRWSRRVNGFGQLYIFTDKVKELENGLRS